MFSVGEREEKMSDMITEIDKRGLIKDSYLIDGIRVEECRSIFLDWALFEDHTMPQADRIKLLIETYGTAAPDHPMTGVLQAALDAPQGEAKRRGGRSGRLG